MSRPDRHQQVERLRGVPLDAVLRAAGARPDPADKAKWRTARGTLSVNQCKFFNWQTHRGGGGAIDLAMHLTSASFTEAVEWLQRRFPLAHSPPSLPPQAAPPAGPLRMPAAHSDNLLKIQRYLCHRRCIPSATVASLCEAGMLFADRRANAVFVMRGPENNPVGAELRGSGPAPWRGMAPGSRKDLGYFRIAPFHPVAIVLCESAIDALSCFSLYPRLCCISTAGARPNPKWLPALLAYHLPIFCGFDADPTGDAMANAMSAQHPHIKRFRPPRHDWNDVLRPRA